MANRAGFEGDPVEVIDLVAAGVRTKSFAFKLKELSVAILSAHDYAVGDVL